MRIVAVSVLLAALAVTVTAHSYAAATPIQRLTYQKATAYWQAEGKQHGLPVTCKPYSPRWPLQGTYECVFGTVNRAEILAQTKATCELVVAFYGKTRSVRGGNALTGSLGTSRVKMCRAGWTDDLPSPWNPPAAER